MENFSLSPIAARCLSNQIQALQKRAMQIDFVAMRLQSGTLSKGKLEDEMYKAFGYYAIGLDTIIYDLNTYGRRVESEVRAEETIYVDVDLTEPDLKFVINKDNTITLTKHNGKTFTVYNPQVEMSDHLITIRGKRPVQVRRKYYSWVR